MSWREHYASAETFGAMGLGVAALSGFAETPVNALLTLAVGFFWVILALTLYGDIEETEHALEVSA